MQRLEVSGAVRHTVYVVRRQRVKTPVTASTNVRYVTQNTTSFLNITQSHVSETQIAETPKSSTVLSKPLDRTRVKSNKFNIFPKHVSVLFNNIITIPTTLRLFKSSLPFKLSEQKFQFSVNTKRS
jgi:hypothetical protein